MPATGFITTDNFLNPGSRFLSYRRPWTFTLVCTIFQKCTINVYDTVCTRLRPRASLFLRYRTGDISFLTRDHMKLDLLNDLVTVTGCNLRTPIGVAT